MKAMRRITLKNGNGNSWSLYKAGVVADLSVSGWGSAAKLTPQDLGLTHVNDELIKLGKKKLLKKEHRERIDQIDSEARRYLDRNSFQFPFGTARFIPYSRLPEVLKKMEEFKAEFLTAIEEFMELYPKNRAEMISEYEKAFEDILSQHTDISDEEKREAKRRLLERLEDLYPVPEKLKRKFGLDFVIFEIEAPEFKSLDTEEAVDKAKISMEMEQRYREKVSEKIDLFLEDVISKLKSMILESTSHMLKRLTDGNVSLKTVNSFKKFAEEFRNLNFVDYDVEVSLRKLNEKLLTVTSKEDLKDEEFQKKLKKDIEEITDMVTHVDVSKVLGKFKRRISMME